MTVKRRLLTTPPEDEKTGELAAERTGAPFDPKVEMIDGFATNTISSSS